MGVLVILNRLGLGDIAGVTSGAGGPRPPCLKAWRNRSSCQRGREIIKERQVLLRLTSIFLWRSSYNVKKVSRLVCGMFMLVGAEK